MNFRWMTYWMFIRNIILSTLDLAIGYWQAGRLAWKGSEFLQNLESEWPAKKVCQVASEQNTREVKLKYKYDEGVYVNLIQSWSNFQCDVKHSSWRLNAKRYSN